MLGVVGSEAADMCSTARWIAQRSTFITSPRYPHSYPPNSECVCSVVTQRNQRLLVRTAADSVLEWTPGCRADVLVIYDGSEQTLVRCGHLPLGLNVTSHTHTIFVAFRSDEQRQHNGFWLAIEGHCSTDTDTITTVICIEPHIQLDGGRIWLFSDAS